MPSARLESVDMPGQAFACPLLERSGHAATKGGVLIGRE